MILDAFKSLFGLKKKKNEQEEIINKMEENCSNMLNIAETLPDSDSKEKIMESLNRQTQVIKKFKK